MANPEEITIEAGKQPNKAIAPRNTDTVTYEVIEELPNNKLPKPPNRFSAYAWGEVIAQVLGIGPVCTNKDLQEWVEQGKLKIVSNTGSWTKVEKGEKTREESK